MDAETKRLINELTGTARVNCDNRKTLRELFEALNDPGFITNKDFALTVCNALITICVDRGGMKEGSIMHLAGRRLMDYIGREGSPGETTL